MQRLAIVFACGLGLAFAVAPAQKAQKLGADAAEGRPHTCKLENCILKSPLAKAGPAFPDGVRFFATKSGQKDSRAVCPFADNDDEKEVTDEEYKKYMTAMDKIGDMSYQERVAYARAHQDEYLNRPEREPVAKEPRVNVSEPGVHAVNSSTWAELRQANKHELLITFYAPWCPFCKAFVVAKNAPINALSAALEKVNGPKVVKFDVEADTAPLVIEAIPTVFLFKTNGEAIEFEGDTHDTKALMAFALQSQKKPALVESKQNLRRTAK